MTLQPSSHSTSRPNLKAIYLLVFEGDRIPSVQSYYEDDAAHRVLGLATLRNATVASNK